MKLRTSSLFVLSVALSFAATGCGNNAANKQAAQEQAAVQALQNPSGCLDLSKVSDKINHSEKSRTILTDAKLDGSPSEAMLAQVNSDISSNDSDSASSPDTIQQSGCSSISDKDSSGQVTQEKILSSSPRLLDTEQNLDLGNGKSAAVRVKFELITSRQIRATIQEPETVAHICNGKEIDENLNLTETVIMDLGKKKLPAAEQKSPELLDLAKKASDAAAKIQGEDQSSIDADFCASHQ